MSNFINSSALTKLLANIFIFLVVVAFLGIAVYDTVTGTQVPAIITNVLYGAVMSSLAILGFHVGSVQTLQSQQSSAETTAAITTAVAAPTHPQGQP